MTRKLGSLTLEEREKVVLQIQQEAENNGWSSLNNQKKGLLYAKWETAFDLSHATIKDRIMKGFDAVQAIAKRGEAQIQDELIQLFRQSGLTVVAPYPILTGNERIDMVLGYHESFPTHVVEVERADSWVEGLRQVLWYRAIFWGNRQKQVLPMLILFGNASQERFSQIIQTCNDNRIALLTYQFQVEGRSEEEHSVSRYLSADNA